MYLQEAEEKIKKLSDIPFSKLFSEDDIQSIIINKGKTRMEGAADLVFHDSISKVLEKIR